MHISDWLTVVAILFAPLVAIEVQRWIEVFREKRERKLRIFETLMTTRAARVSWHHVEALNRIDITFDRENEKERAVIDAWKSYLDQLSGLGEKPDDVKLQNWLTRKEDLFVELLYAMSQAVGYDFDRVYLKRSIYSPQGHGEEELDQLKIRKGLAEVLSGKGEIPVRLIGTEEVMQQNAAYQKTMIEYVEAERAAKAQAKKDGNGTAQ